MEFDYYLQKPGRIPVAPLLEANGFAYFRSNEPKQKGIFFQWFALEPRGAIEHTMGRRHLLGLRASLLMAYCLLCLPETLYCPGTNPSLMLTIRQGIISFLTQFLKQQLILNNCHYKQLCSIVLITKRNGSRSPIFFSTHIINLLKTEPRLELEAVI